MYTNVRRVLGVVLMLILVLGYWVGAFTGPSPELRTFYTTTPLHEIFAACVLTLWLIIATVYAFFLGWKGRRMRGVAAAIIIGEILWVIMLVLLPRISEGATEPGAMSPLVALFMILGPPVVALLDLFLPEGSQPYETP